MSRLIRLYPPAWRERYRDELDELLAARRPTIRDRFDIVRGALDAWLHPELIVRAPRPDRGSTGAGARRLGGAAAILGGGLWIIGGVTMHAIRTAPTLADQDSIEPWLILVAGAIVTAVAAIAMAASAPQPANGSRVAARWMLIGAVVIGTPWPLLVFGFYGYAAATAAYGVQWARAGGQPLAALLAVAALVLLLFNTEDERALLTIPLGLAWIVLGALAVRRAPAPARA